MKCLRDTIGFVAELVDLSAARYLSSLLTSLSVVLPGLLASVGVVTGVARTSAAHALASLATVSVAATKGQQTTSIGVSELFETVCAFAKRFAIRSIGEAAAVAE